MDELLTVAEAAGYMKVNRNTVYRWCDAGLLPYRELETGGGRRFLRKDLEGLLREPGVLRDRARYVAKVARLEELVYPKGRENGPTTRHARSREDIDEVRRLVQQVEADGEYQPMYHPGARAVLLLARDLLDNLDPDASPSGPGYAPHANRNERERP